MINVLNSVSNLEAISLAVSITVIVLLVVAFGALFYLYYRYYGKCIDKKVEDTYITKEVILENKKYFVKTEETVNDGKTTIEYKKENITKLSTSIQEGRKSANIIKIIANTILIIVYAVFLGFMGFAIYVRASGQLFMINDTACLIIKSGSMSEINEDNKDLIENNIDNQIQTYALIGIEKAQQEDIKLYDIVAFKDPEGNIIVHRIIHIHEEDGKTLYTTRGDANKGSAGYEIDLEYEDFIGKYNGFQNVGLGLFIYYMQSGIGMITISLALVLIGFYDVLDIYLGKKITLRKDEIIVKLENEIDYAILNEKEIHYLDWAKTKDSETYEFDDLTKVEEAKEETIVEEQVEETTEEAVENVEEAKESNEDVQKENKSHLFTSTGEPRKTKDYERISFSERFLTIDEELQDRYNALKSEIISYGVKSRISATGDTYRLHKKTYCKIAISGKNLKLYLALDYNDYKDTTYPVKDVGNKGVYADIPVVLKVRSDLSLKRAKELIKDCMIKDNLTQKEVVEFDHYNELKTKILNNIQDDVEDDD